MLSLRGKAALIAFALLLAAVCLLLFRAGLNAGSGARQGEMSKAQEALYSFLEEEGSGIVTGARLSITASNKAKTAAYGSAISFVATVSGLDSEGRPLTEEYRGVSVQAAPGIAVREEGTASITADAAKKSITIYASFLAQVETFSYTLVSPIGAAVSPCMLLNQDTPPITPGFPPPTLIDIEGVAMQKEAGEALDAMLGAARAEGIDLFAFGGYRSYEEQKGIYEYSVAMNGSQQRIHPPPGYSEHQTGLAVDLTTDEIVEGKLMSEFNQTQAYRWLEKNAHLYGYIERYSNRNQSVTQYSYEPWHYRYIGAALATQYKDEGAKSLEVFLSSYPYEQIAP